MRWEVGPWGHDLVFEENGRHSVGIADLGREDNGVGVGRLLGRVFDLANVGCGVAREDRVLRPRSREGGRAPRASQRVVERGVDEFDRGAISTCRDWPGKAHPIVDLVDHEIGLVAESNSFPLGIEFAKEGAARARSQGALQDCRVLRDDEKRAPRNGGFGWKDVVDRPR